MDRIGHHAVAHSGSGVVPALVLIAAALAAAAYLHGARRRSGRWPLPRTVSFLVGTTVSAGTILFVIENRSLDYPNHMVAHIVGGMVAPLLLVAGAPITLMLRSLHVDAARRLTRLLRWRVIGVLTHPVTAGVLDVGGLWLIYTTGLYAASHDVLIVLVAVQLHLLLAGYLFTASILGVDPAPHRPGYGARAAVLVAGFAAHGILAKHLVEHPPAGIDPGSALTGSMVMYYGGDVVEVALLVMLGTRWYASTRPGRSGRRIAGTDAALP